MITKQEAEKLKNLVDRRICDELELKRINETNQAGKRDLDTFIAELQLQQPQQK